MKPEKTKPKPVHDAKMEEEMEDRFLDAIIAGINKDVPEKPNYLKRDQDGK
jgi:hypothetical protein